MARASTSLSLAAVLALLAGCVSSPKPAGAAPQGVAVDAASHYSGAWLEIARRPMKITDGCVAGFTTYAPRADGKIAVTDGCREGTPDGKLKTIKGVGTIGDPGVNAKLRVRYLWVITRDYWVLDKAADDSWFISADPALHDLYIYARRVPSKPLLDQMVERARGLGYDVAKLEFPAQ